MTAGGSPPKLLVAGATGALGRHVVGEALRRGFHVRALVNQSTPRELPKGVEVYRANARNVVQLRDVCDHVDTVFSALGASVLPNFAKGRRSYFAVDTRANLNLVAAARAARVRRFGYVSVACHRALGDLAYVRAHERVVGALAASGMPHVVVRPTGFFSAFGAVVGMALKGRLPIIGDGSAKTNPIHDAELAAACVDALEGEQAELEVGGPEVLTRRAIVEAAFGAVGKPTKVTTIPPAIARLMGYGMWPINPRMAQLTQFVAAVSVRDVVAPARGARRLADYFAEVAEAKRSDGHR